MPSLSFSLRVPALQPLSPPKSSSSSFMSRPIPFKRPSYPKTTNLHRFCRPIPPAINVTAGNPEEPLKNFDPSRVIGQAQDLFDNLPQPVKDFPWAKTLESFFNIVLDLVIAVVKWLSIPVLFVTSLSEMSYCAHERKMGVVPVPFVLGFAIAGVLKDTAIELSPDVKEGGFPWHLLLIAAFFALLKLPGPYYPYWGRVVIPHFANGGLWRSVWLSFMWYRRARPSPLTDTSNY